MKANNRACCPRLPILKLKRHNLRNASVRIFKADNIVLSQITTALHFDQFQRRFARVFQAMGRAQRNIG